MQVFRPQTGALATPMNCAFATIVVLHVSAGSAAERVHSHHHRDPDCSAYFEEGGVHADFGICPDFVSAWLQNRPGFVWQSRDGDTVKFHARDNDRAFVAKKQADGSWCLENPQSTEVRCRADTGEPTNQK